MQKVLGIGGLFFKARDPEGLASWYEAHLGIPRSPAAWEQQQGETAFAPFPEDTSMFPDTRHMVNFRVADLVAMTQQLRAAGIAVEIDPENYPYGRFASLADPEGNPIQLWEAR